MGDDDRTIQGQLRWRLWTRFLATDDFAFGNNQSKNENHAVQTETVYKLRRESKNA